MQHDANGRGAAPRQPATVTRIIDREDVSQAIMRREKAIAGLAEGALGASLPRVVTLAVEALVTALGTRYAKAMEVLPGGEEGFAVRAAFGWGSEVVGRRVEGFSHASYVLAQGKAETVASYWLQADYEVPPVLEEAGVTSGITVPVRRPGGGYWGTLGVYENESRRFDVEEERFVERVAGVVERRLAADDRRAAASPSASAAVPPVGDGSVLSHLLDTQAALAVAENAEDACRATARHAVPAFSDWCYVDLVEAGSGGEGIVRRALEFSEERAFAAAVRGGLMGRHPYDASSSHVTQRVLRTGRPELLPNVGETDLRRLALDESQLALLRRLGPRSYLCVPLEVGRRRIGVVGFFSTTSGRTFGPENQEAATAHAGLLALCLAGCGRWGGDARIAEHGEDGEAGASAENPRVRLSKRQREILELCDKGLTQNEAGEALHITMETVRTHTKILNRKIGVDDYRKLPDRARALGLLPPHRQGG